MRTIATALLLSVLAVPASAQRVAVAGDSATDEFRGTDNRCGTSIYRDTTKNWLELLVDLRHLDVGIWGTYSEPRRRGYSQNWARSGAVSADVNSRGQAVGVASQSPDVALLMVGSNDINPAYKDYPRRLYYNTLSASSRAYWINQIVSAHTRAITTMRSTGATAWMATIGKYPQPHPSYQNPAGLARIALAVSEMNAKLVAAAPVYGYSVLDLNAFETWLMARGTATAPLLSGQPLLVGGRTIVLGASCNPVNLLLNDGHGGTVLNGLLASYIAEVTGITTPLSDAEIVAAAGL